jgi:hypothetical protein
MFSKQAVKAFHELANRMTELSDTELDLFILIIDLLRASKSQQRELNIIGKYEPMLKAELERRETIPLTE